MPEVNWIAVLIAAVSAFALGALWYAPPVFGRKWMQLTGMEQPQRHPGITFGVGFILSLVAAAVFAMFLGPDVSMAFGTAAGFAAGLFWVGTSFGINYLFEEKPLGLWLINAGYHTIQFTLYGFIIGLMN